MSTRKSKRQAATAAAAASDNDEQKTLLNGNGSAHPSTAELTSNTPRENIFLFWPNVIGYVRIFLALASLYYMPLHPRTCSVLYSVSALLDALDGYAARHFEQSTRFGAVLDMVTDRCATSCLLVFLACAFPRWTIVFQGLLSLDFSSHYIHMYASLAMGGATSSHKSVDKSRSWILNLYYTNKTFLFVCCALNELFFIGLYLLSFSSPYLSPQLLKTAAGAEIEAGAQANSSIIGQLFTNPYSAAALEMARANKMDSFVPWVITGVSFPVMAVKQAINVVQLVKACRWLAEGDLQMRKEQGLPRQKKTL